MAVLKIEPSFYALYPTYADVLFYRGFALSDHADWPGLLQAIHDTGAERVYVTHGYIAPLVRWLNEHGTYAEALPTHYKGDDGAEEQLPVITTETSEL